MVYLAQGQEDLARLYLDKVRELGWTHHLHAEASQLMMNGELDAAFARLPGTLIDSRTDSVSALDIALHSP